MTHDQFLPDEDATTALGRQLGGLLRPGMTLTLSGDLGAGKTTLARGILRGLGFEGRVKSPTFSLVEVYKFSRLNLYHFDFYRFSDPREWDESGFREYFNDGSVCLVEWPERAIGLTPPDLAIQLSLESAGRHIRLTPETAAGQTLLTALISPIC